MDSYLVWVILCPLFGGFLLAFTMSVEWQYGYQALLFLP
jgi:hypothetical protein